jgi:hypothetical protein
MKLPKKTILSEYKAIKAKGEGFARDFVFEKKADVLAAKSRVIGRKYGYGGTVGQKESVKAEGYGREIVIEVIANVSNFFDYDNDVVLAEAYNRALQKASVPILDSHSRYSVKDSLLGKSNAVKVITMDAKAISEQYEGQISALVYEANLYADCAGNVITKYQRGIIDQHSIGFKYLDMFFAAKKEYGGSDEEDKLYQMYYPLVVNKAELDRFGYFFGIKDIDIKEFSPVVFGANKMTPVMSVARIEAPKHEKKESAKSQFEFLLN